VSAPVVRIEHTVVPSVDKRGWWQVKVRQRPDGKTPMWFDAGDPRPTLEEANSYAAELDLLAAVTDAQAEMVRVIDEAQARRDAAMRTAHNAGVSQNRIAIAAGLSQPAVLKILRKEAPRGEAVE
jgi:hypothetical protein